MKHGIYTMGDVMGFNGAYIYIYYIYCINIYIYICRYGYRYRLYIYQYIYIHSHADLGVVPSNGVHPSDHIRGNTADEPWDFGDVLRPLAEKQT